MSDTLHARLRAAVEQRLAVARAASPRPWTADDHVVGYRHGAVANTIDAGTRENAAHIAANDPAAVIRRCEALLRVVERHRPVKARGGPVGWESDRIACDACAPTRWPCPDVRDLAAGEGIEVGDG